MEQGRRPMLPLVPRSPTSAGPPGAVQSLPSSKKRRTETKVACNNCRAKKGACNGIRPSCSRCIRQNETCIYTSKDVEETHSMAKIREIEEARSVIKDYEDIISHLQSVSEPEALASLRRLRSALSMPAFLSEVKATQLSTQLQVQSGNSGDRDANPIAGLTSDEPQNRLLSEMQGYKAHQQHKGVDPSLLSLDKRISRDYLAPRELTEIHIKHTSKAPQTILQQLRSSSNPQSILDMLRGDINSITRPSEHKTARSVTPPVQTPHELQLMVRHPVCYPRMDPGNLKQSRGIPPELLAARTIPEQYWAVSSSSSTVPRRGNASKGKTHLHEAQRRFSPSATKSSTAFDWNKPPSYFDPCLAALDIQFWTVVPVENSIAAKAISSYIATDHAVLGLFEPVAFLSALVRNDISICSKFEINALLAFALHAYSTDSSLTASYISQFEAEADRLWCGERTIDSHASIVGLSFLFLFYGSRGQGELAQARLQDIAEMAQRMKLFVTADAKSANDIISLPSDVQRATAYAAWGAFNLISMQSLFWVVDFPEHPPSLLIPTEETSLEDESSASELTQTNLSSLWRITFTACCQFWTIVSEVLALCHAKDSQSNLSLVFVLSQYQKLLNWADCLPVPVARNETSPGHILVFHIWLHAVILHIFRPFVSSSKQHDLGCWTPLSPAPEAIFSASLKQLKYLVLLYLHNHVSAPKSVLWNVALIYIANAVLKNSSDPEWYFYFMLCVYTYRDIAPNFPVAEGIAQGLLAIAVGNGVVTSAEAAFYMDGFKLQDRRRTLEKSQGNFILDLDLAITDKEAAQVDVLVGQFDKITTFSEWTNDEY